MGGTAGTAPVAEVGLGVGWGVDDAELALATDIGVGVCFAFAGRWYTVPSSPGAKVSAEQKPSEEVMSKV
jgi:hypothetical protein